MGKAGGGKHLPGGGAPFSYIPPSAIQNAMMTKDKKPFTYTPGGIDFLAEIRSPRMQRRISKNAADEGVASHPNQTTQHNLPKPTQLSPQALMAMQPQMAVPVFPLTPQQTIPHSPVTHPSKTSPTSTSPAITSPLPPSPPTTQQSIHQQQNEEPPQPMRINLKPAVPQFLQSQPQTQSPEQMFEEIMNSLTARNANSHVHSPSPVQSSTQPIASSVSSTEPSTEHRGAQLGSLYIPPVNGSVSGGGSNANNATSGPTSPFTTAQLAKAPMPPWMNSQNRTSNSPTPTFVHNPQQPQERVIPVEREEVVQNSGSSSSGNVRLVPIMVEGGRTGATQVVAPPTPQRNSSIKDEAVHPPWYNAPGKVIPIHMESSGLGATITPSFPPRQSETQQSYQHLPQQQQAPWRMQATSNANQIASMMEE